MIGEKYYCELAMVGIDDVLLCMLLLVKITAVEKSNY
jgi:hypothetical protein